LHSIASQKNSSLIKKIFLLINEFIFNQNVMWISGMDKKKRIIWSRKLHKSILKIKYFILWKTYESSFASPDFSWKRKVQKSKEKVVKKANLRTPFFLTTLTSHSLVSWELQSRHWRLELFLIPKLVKKATFETQNLMWVKQSLFWWGGIYFL